MEEYLNFAKEVADEAALIALKYFSFETENTWKEDGSPLTKADTEINDFVISKVNSRYPDHSVLGEEESNKKEGSRYVWVCDPIDGTIPFSCGLPIFTFSLALVDQADGQPVLGLVNDPVAHNMYYAYKGGGAYRNGKKIFVSKGASLQKTYISLENFSYLKETISALQEKGAKVFKFMSFIYGGVQVANGKFAGSIFFGPFAHDVAALKIIVEEAGGKATDIEGKGRRYDVDGRGCVLSNGILHGEILKTIAVKEFLEKNEIN